MIQDRKNPFLRGEQAKQSVILAAQDERRREYNAYINALKQAKLAEQEGSNRVETPKNTIKADTLISNKPSTSERPAETQTRNNKAKDSKHAEKREDNKNKQLPKKNVKDEISKWAPSWHVPTTQDYSKFAEENRKQMYLDYHNLVPLAEGPTTNVTSKAMQDKAVAEEKRLLDSDYTKRKTLLEQQRRNAINSQAANASNPSVSEQYSREADRITKKLETLDQEYFAANERLASGIDRGTIAMKSWQKLSDSLTRNLYAQLNEQRAQYSQLENDPSTDNVSKQKLWEQNDRLIKKINALESKAGLLDKWIRKNGIPKDLNQIPKDLRGIAEQIVRNGGTLDTGFRTPQQIKEEGEKVRKSAFDQKGSTVETNVNSDLMSDYRDKLIAQARMIEDKHGISRTYADFENTDSNDGVAGHLLHGVRSTPLGWLNTGVYQLRLGEDREQYNQIIEAIHSIDKALKYKDINDSFYKESDSNRYWNKNEAANVAKSFWNNAVDTSIWDFGTSDLSKAMMINSIREAQDRGDRFTVAQRDMLNAMAIDAVMHDKYSEYEDAWGVSAGSTFAQSLPFMLDMMIGSHGLASVAKAGEKTAVAKVAKFLTGETGKAMQRQALREAIEQYGVRGVEAAMSRNIKQIPGLLTRLSGDATNALLLANTVQGAKTTSDILNLHNGLVDYKINEDGSITGTGLKQGLEWGEAIRQAETRAWIENFSEALGEYDIFTNTFKPLTRKLAKANYALKTGKQLSDIARIDVVAKNLLRGGKAVKEVFDTVNKYNPFAGGKMRDFLHAARYHGAIGESLEEYYGMALEHAMDVSDSGKSFWEDLVSEDNFWDIVGGIALSQAFLGTAGGAHVLSSRNRYKYAQSRAAKQFGDSWKPMEDAIINASSENVARVVNSMAAATKSIEDKQALFDYYTELMSYRGASYAEQQAQDARNSSNHAKAIRDSYETGYMVSTQNARNDMDRAIEGVRQNLNQAFGVEDIDQAIEDNGGLDELASRLDDDQLRNVLVAYDNMLATRDGMTQRQNDDLEIMLQQATDDVMHLRYRDGSNKIVAAQLKNGQTVFITNGLHDDYQRGKILATGFDGQRFELDRDQIAEDEKGREIIDEYDVQSFINSQQQKILEDYLITDENRNQRNPEVKTGTVVRLQDGGILTVLGTARDGGVLYSIREYNNDKQTSVKETTLKAESTAQMAEIIKDANADRQNAIAVKFLENAAKENSKQPSIPAEQPVVDDQVAQELADQINLRVEETLRKPTDFIPSGRRGAGEADDKGFIPNRGNAQKTYNNAVNAVKRASTAKDYTEFTQKLEQAGFAVPFQYVGRLQTLYKAYQAGQISDKELALVFVPNDERKNVAGKKLAKRFENLEFDSEGNIISSRRPKTATNKPVESTSTAEPAVMPPAEKNTISRADLDESDTMTKFVADWIDQDPNGGQATVVSSDGKTATVEYYTEDSNGEKTKRTASVRLKQKEESLEEPSTTHPVEPQIIPHTTPPEGPVESSENDEEDDPLLNEVIDFVRADGFASASQIQRRFAIGYNRAGKIIDLLIKRGIIDSKKVNWQHTIIPTAKPAPESTNAGTVEAVDQVLQNNPQQAAIDALMSKIAADKAAVKIDLRTGHDYFIEVGGKLVMYSRVHSILDSQYPDRSSKINNKQTFLNKLAAARSNKKDWEELARLLAKQHNERYPNEEPVNVEVYIKYAQDNPNEIAEVEEAISDLCSNEDTHLSVKYGNIIDRLCRDFFGNKLMGYWQYKDVMDEKLYYKILQQLDSIRQIYIARGWKLITEPVYLHSELQDAQGNTVRVAGETDMIAVDKDGNYHIIDFKTSYGKFVPEILGSDNKKYTYDRFSEAFPTIESMSVEPRTAKRTYRQQYSNQLTMYSIMAEDNLDGGIKSISLLPWHLSYEPHQSSVWFNDATNFESVVNQEGTDYIRDSENNPIQKPVLLELDKTSDVLNRFTPPTQAEPEKTQAADAVAQGEISAMSDVLAEEADSITDDVKNAAAKLVEAQNAVVEDAQNTGDAKAHENAQKQSEQNAASAQELQQIAEQQATETAQAELNAKAAETKAEQQKQEVVQDWTQHTTTHTHTLDNSIGIEEATAIDDASKKLKYVTGEPDFVSNSRFIFGVTNINGQEKLTVQVVYKGVTYQPVTISTANNPLGRKFYGKVRQALRKANSNQVVVATSVKRTGGRMHAGNVHLMTEAAPGQKTLVSTKRGEGEVYLYDVQLGPQFGRVVEQGNMYEVVVPGINGGKNQTVHTFNKNVEALAGTYAMVLNRHFQENEKQSVPISMHHAKMTEGDADLIIDILNGKHSANGAKMQASLSQHFVDGNVDYGMTNLQVLNLLIQIGQPQGSSRLHLEFDTMSQDAVRIVGPVNGNNIADRVFYLNTDTGRNAFKEFLTENVTKQLSDTIMYHRLGKNTTSATQPFHGILDFVRTASGQQMLQQKGQIQFGKSSIIFDLADFKDPENPNDKLGLTGLGWYMKRGFIQTLFDGIDDTLLDFDNTADVRIEDDNLPPSPPVQQVVNNPVETGVVEATTEIITDQLPDTFDYDQNDWDVEWADKRISKNEKTNGTIKEDNARKNLEKIFGENGVKVEFVDNVIAMMRDGAKVVGRCYSDAIILSRRADAGVEYHEAFHRVVELLLTEKQRSKVYAAFRNAKKGRKNLTDGQIAEALADNFMYFMQNRPAFKFTFNLKKMFTQISDWVKMLHDIGSFRLTYLYLVTANGRFRNVQPTAEAKARFKAFAKHGLNFTKRGTDLQHTLNEHHYRTLVKSLTYLFMNPATQKIEWTGANIQELKIDKELAMNSQIWKQWMDPIGTKDGKPVYRVPYETRAALQEMMDNWDVVQPDIASKIAQFSTDFKVKYEDANHTQLDTAVPDVQNELDTEGNINDDDPASAGAEATDGHIKASYEFNPFNRASEKVKFFFAGIPDYMFDANGRKRPMLNECGLPQLMSAAQVYARMLNDMHTIKDVNELRRELARLGQNDYMYATISRRFEQLYQAIVPEKGKEVDYDAEQLIAQITQTVRQNKNIFEIAKTRKTDEGFTIDIIPSDAGYTSRKFTEDWSQQFAAGAGLFIKQNERGEYVMKPGLTPWVFTTVYRMYAGNNNQGGMIQALSPTNQNPTPFNLNGIEIDINNPEHIDMCKHQIVRTLRWFGINFEKEALDYTLIHEYGGKGANELYQFLTDTRFGGFKSFLNLVSSLNYNGTLNIEGNTVPFLHKRNGDPVQVDEIFSYNGFVKSLASRKYAYRHSFDQMSVLATNNKQFYEMSENNFLTDRLFEMQTDPNELASAKADPYIYIEEEQLVGENTKYGSLIVEHIDEGRGPLEIATLIGFSSYEAGADDVDYAQMSAREDYIAKFSALLSGRMVFPTQSDKKTWGYVKGLMLPGLDFKNLAKTMPTSKGRIVSDVVLDRLIAYAKTEDAAISRFLEEYNSIPEEQRVENYDGGSEVEETLANGEKVKHRVLQGGRYSALLGVWDGDTFIEFNRLFDENGVYQDERMCQQRAHDYFFSKSLEQQRDMMNTILLKQTEQELEYICELGLINSVQKQNASDSNMLAYKNVGLDYRKVDAVYNLLAATYPNGNQERLRRTALMMVVGDVVAKGIISMNEYERVFCGQPSFFKFKYDKEGHLINRTDDQSKRLGGLVSTGFNNVMLPGIPEEYTCAEVQDEKVSQDNIEEIHKMMYEGTVRQTYLRNKLEEKSISFEDVHAAKEVADQVDAMNIEDIEATFDDTVKSIINQSVDAKVKAFKKINVTDGASYISEQMCENLLRMAGSFSGDVKRAFDMLTGKKVDGKVYTTKDIRELADAYQIVLTSVIGAQKYTAYGFREREFIDNAGNRTITHIPYYNKTALFPIFKSIATGPLADFYQKMQDNKIDMIMMHSAVKVGGQGAIPVKWIESVTDKESGENVLAVRDDKGTIEHAGKKYRKATQEEIDGPQFNIYTQKVKYLRKQFNTDPKEREEMSIGTQTKKVALSTLTPGRTYSVGDETLSATEVRDRIMDSLNSMSDIGEQTVKDMFFTEGQFDVQKFSDLLTKELVGRGASAEMIDAVSVENGQLKLPLSALSGMNWIQSIIKSMIDKRVLDTNTPGKAFYQRSVWGMEGQSILSDDNIPPTINGGKKLQVNNEDNSMDIVLSIDYFEDILKKAKVKSGRKVKKTRKVKRNQYVTYEKYGQPVIDYTKTQEVEVEEEYETDEYVPVSTLSFEEQKKWLEDHNIIGHNAKANIIGYRIPTQAVSSIHAMRCVDVLPVVRDTIIMPAAITSITGSDRQYHCSNQSNIKNSFNCWELFNQQRQSATKTTLYYVCVVRFND